MKVVYIAHPIGGDVENNIEKVLGIIKEINLNYSDVVPFAPYIVDCLALDDNDLRQRERGIKNDIELFNRGFINEVWLYGDRVSKGMLEEVKLAHKLSIPVFCKTKQTTKDYLKYLNTL